MANKEITKAFLSDESDLTASNSIAYSVGIPEASNEKFGHEGFKVLEKIRYSHRSEYVLRPDFTNTVRMFNKN